MKKKLILLCSIGTFSISYSQVGINTENPQGMFHVDGGKDNASTGTPTVPQQANDFTILNTGNVGIGTTTPSNKLDINSSTAGAIKIVDGTQAAGRLLVSNSEGVATWQETTGATTVINSNAGIENTPISPTALTFTGAQVTVTTPGYYIISPRLIFNKAPASCSIYAAYNLSKTPTAPTPADKVFSEQDIHMPAALGGSDYIYTSNIGFLDVGTYYFVARYGSSVGTPCTSYVTRGGIAQNSFTITLLK